MVTLWGTIEQFTGSRVLTRARLRWSARGNTEQPVAGIHVIGYGHAPSRAVALKTDFAHEL